MRLTALDVTAQATALADLLKGGALVVLNDGAQPLASCLFGQITQNAGTLQAQFRGESQGYGIPSRFVAVTAQGAIVGEGDPSDLSIDIAEVTVNATLIGTFTHTVPR